MVIARLRYRFYVSTISLSLANDLLPEKLAARRPFAPSPIRPVTPSPIRPVTPSPIRPVTHSPRHPVASVAPSPIRPTPASLGFPKI